jgi:hypothetical protein
MVKKIVSFLLFFIFFVGIWFSQSYSAVQQSFAPGSLEAIANWQTESNGQTQVSPEFNSSQTPVERNSNSNQNSNVCQWDDCINSQGFKISVSKIAPGGDFVADEWLKTTPEVVNFVLGTIIQKLMIALGSLALIIMTIWAGYMILAHGQDELLSKWKSIFISGITSLVVALSAYYLVSFIRFILYSGT